MTLRVSTEAPAKAEGRICKRGFAARATPIGHVNLFANLIRFKVVYSYLKNILVLYTLFFAFSSVHAIERPATLTLTAPL